MILIIATIGLSSGLLTQKYFAAIIIAVIVSTIATPPLLKILLGNKDESATENEADVKVGTN